MSFAARLRVCGANIQLNYYSLEIRQDTDSRGRPSSIARGGTITVEYDTIYSTDDITDWMTDPVKKESGSVVFMQTDQEAALKTVSFTDGLCVEFHERFDGTMSSGTMTTVLTITAPQVDVGGEAVDNHWDRIS